MRALLVDDEKQARIVLRKLLAQFDGGVDVCGEAESVEEAVELINNLKPDLLFLDIRLHQNNGFNVLKQVDTAQLSVIFTTAHIEYALKAIKYAALDYLLKPIDPDELKEAVKKAFQQGERTIVSRLEVLESLLRNQTETMEKIVLADQNGFKAVLLKDIVHCQGERNYTTFFLSDNRKIITSKPLIAYERLLEGTAFIRIYKSHLINIAHVKEYIRGRGGWVIMTNGKKLPVSREKKNEFITLFTK